MKLMLLMLMFFCLGVSAQPYALLDKTMQNPIRYSTEVTVQDEYRNVFPIEKKNLAVFVQTLHKISTLLGQKTLPPVVEINIGKTHFKGIKIIKPRGDRMDIILSTDYGNRQIKMHLCDENVTLASNIFFINTWADYVSQGLKK